MLYKPNYSNVEHPPNRKLLIRLFGLEWIRQRDQRMIKPNTQLKLEI